MKDNTSLPQNLPDVGGAQLPASYESARAHLEACTQIDECKSWADKAAALASYAKQSQDDQLENYARRIRARAIRRAGQLLEAIAPGKGGQPSHPTGAGADPSRKQAAAEAGLSPRQQKQAQRVARVPDAEFDQAVEADRPASISAISEKGKKAPAYTEEQVAGFRAHAALQSQLRQVMTFAETFSLDEIADRMTEDDSNQCQRAAGFFRGLSDVFKGKS